MKLETQNEWGWRIAIYLFLVGTGAGTYTVSAFTQTTLTDTGAILGWCLVVIGAGLIFAEIKHKPRAIGAIRNPQTSWMSRGAIFEGCFILSVAIYIGTRVWPFQWFVNTATISLILEFVCMLSAICIMFYTGILLAVSRSIALWSTPLVPLLFVLSSITGGIMVFELAASVAAIDPLVQLAEVNLTLLIIQSVAMAIYILLMERTTESRHSCYLLLDGKLALPFWLGVIFAGLLLPMIAQILMMSNPDPLATILLVCIPGLTGALLLRYVILAAGVRAPLRAGGIEFPVPSTHINPVR